jgi:glucose dehydrogenase
VFVGATDDAQFRRSRSKSGKELWTAKLNGAVHATFIRYEARDGERYVVIAATGGEFFGNPVMMTQSRVFARRSLEEKDTG